MGTLSFFKKSSFFCCFLFLCISISFGQVTAFFDDFNRLSSSVNTGGTPTISYTQYNTGTGTIGTATSSSPDSVLKVTSGGTAGRSALMGSISSFTSGIFSNTLKSNFGLVTWTFNMRQNRGSSTITSLNGFDDQSTTSKYGIATILVCNKSNPLDTTAKGYAVVMGESGNDTTYNLISFSGGLIKNTNCTTIIRGMVLNYFKDIVSVKVTYNPTDNKWNMYQADGFNSSVDAFPDPTLITGSTLGTVVNNSLVDTTMSSFGFLWNYGTLSSQNAYFDNFKVTVNKPEIRITFPTSAILNDFIYVGAGPSASQFFTISASNLTANVVVTPPTNFLICATFNGTFVSTPITLTQSGGSISSAIVYVKLKGGLVLGNYSETITLTSNNATSKTITCNGSVIGVSGTPSIVFNPVAPVSITFPATEFLANSDYQSFSVTGTNLGAGTVVTFNTTNNFFVSTLTLDNVGVPINPGVSAILTADANGIISGKYIYVRYYPNEQYSANPVSAIDSLGYQSGTITYTYGANSGTAANLKGKIATYYFRITANTTSKLTDPSLWSASKNDVINNVVSNAFKNGTTTSPNNPFAIPGVNYKIITSGYAANSTNISNTTNVSSPTDKTIFKISGAGSKLIIGDPAFPGITFSFPYQTTRKIIGTIDIDTASTGFNKINYQDTAIPTFTFGTFHRTSEFHFQQKNYLSVSPTFGKLFIDVDTLFINSSPSIQTSLTVSSGATLATTRLGNFCKAIMLSGASDTTYGNINIQNSAGLSCGKCTPSSIGAVFNFVDATPNIIFGSNSIAQYAKTNTQSIQPLSYQNVEVTGGSTKTVDITGGNSSYANIANKLTIGAGTILSIPNDNLVLKSDSLKTAMLTPCTGTISGKVIVERFLRTKKAWRLLSSPTKHDGQTIKQSWMEGGSLNSNPSPGYGIQITSNNASWQSDGFDAISSSPSVKYLDSSTNVWTGIASANASFDTGRAYMTFVRGNRSVTAFGQNATSTTLREKGSLRIGSITISPLGTSSGNKFVAIGNPYASAVNLVDVMNLSTNLDSYYYLWDPMLAGTKGLGGYQTVSFRSNGSISGIVPGGGSFPSQSVANLESGQGFIVHTKAGASGSITFNETNKLDSSRLVAKPVKPSTSIRNNLFKMQNGEVALLDGVINVYDSASSDNIDEYDALKLYNPSENIAIKTNNQYIAIENRNSLKVNDTIFYQISNLSRADYKLEFTPESVNSLGLHAYLEDLYLNTKTPVSMLDSSNYNFSVTVDPDSYRSDRFRLVFKHQNTLPVTILNLQAARNEKNLKVQWDVQNEFNISYYKVERSNDGLKFIEIGEVSSNNLSHYQFNDNASLSGIIYYRIVGVENDGNKNYSKVVKVTAGIVAPSISIVPNPIGSDRLMHLNLKSIEEGVYQMDIFDLSGKKVVTKSINFNGFEKLINWQLPATLVAGKYNMIFYNPQLKITSSFILTESK